MSRRYDFAPLESRLRILIADIPQAGDATMARLCGVTAGVIPRWREVGLTMRRAEAIAALLELHPCELWPEWIDDEIAAFSKVCPNCLDVFVPEQRSDQRYCKPQCKQAANNRARDKAARSMQNARYYQAARPARLAYQREYDRQLRERRIRKQAMA